MDECLPKHMYVHHMYTVLGEARRGCRSSETGVKGSCEHPRGCWELNLGPLQEQYGLLITEQPSLQCHGLAKLLNAHLSITAIHTEKVGKSINFCCTTFRNCKRGWEYTQ